MLSPNYPTMDAKHATSDKRRFLEEGNASLCAGVLMGLGSFACPCPFCILSSLSLLLNGLLEKAGIRLWNQ
jgi:hypothetical protein